MLGQSTVLCSLQSGCSPAGRRLSVHGPGRWLPLCRTPLPRQSARSRLPALCTESSEASLKASASFSSAASIVLENQTKELAKPKLLKEPKV